MPTRLKSVDEIGGGQHHYASITRTGPTWPRTRQRAEARWPTSAMPSVE